MPILQATTATSGDASWDTTITGDITLSGTTSLAALLTPTVETAAIAADPTLTSADSQTTYRVDTSGGVVTLALPTAVVGQTYTFVLSDASNDFTVNCAAVTNSMLGAVTIADDEGTGNSNSAAANGTTHDRCLIDVSAGTVVAGSWVRFTALSTTVWFVEGIVISGDGAQAAVVFSSNV